MARVETDTSWATDKSDDLVAAIVDAIAVECKLRPVRADGEATKLEGGSRAKMRLLGAWFQSGTVLPLTGLVTYHAGHVHLHLEEAMGLGMMDPIVRRKYEEEFASISSRLSEALED